MPETLRTFSVSPEDIAETFKPSLQSSWDRYKHAVANWYLLGLSPGEAARREGYSSSRLDPAGRQAYRQFRDQFRSQQPKNQGGRGWVPHQAKVIGKLNHLGVFPGKDGYLYDEDDVLDVESLLPFNANNPRFRALALLSDLQSVEGAIGEHEQATSAVSAYFSSAAMRDPRMVTFLGKSMNTTIDPSKRRLPIDGCHARLLGVMGNHVGNLNQQTSPDFPRPIMAALRTLRGRPSKYEEAVAIQTITDFVLSLFGLDKVKQPDGRYKTRAEMHSPSLPTKDLAEDRARLFMEILAQSELINSVGVFGPYEDSSGLWFSNLNIELLGEVDREILRLKSLFFERLEQLTAELST